jgi:hypothetical protein
LDPETNINNFLRIRDRAIAANKINPSTVERRVPVEGGLVGDDENEEPITLESKREVLRYVIYCTHHIDLFTRFFAHEDFEKRSNRKMEICPPCLMHLYMRVGENLFTSLYQELIRRVCYPPILNYDTRLH